MMGTITPGDWVKLIDGIFPHVEKRELTFQGVDKGIVLLNHLKQEGPLKGRPPDD